jgi:hypothetical protein
MRAVDHIFTLSEDFILGDIVVFAKKEVNKTVKLASHKMGNSSIWDAETQGLQR